MSRCHHCGASMKEYKHNLNLNLCKGLIVLFNKGGQAMLRDLNLNTSQHNNFQKLKHWGLITKGDPDASDDSAYTWTITKRGTDFVKGRISIPKYVVTYRNEVIREEDPQLFMGEALGEHEVWWRENYLENSTERQ